MIDSQRSGMPRILAALLVSSVAVVLASSEEAMGQSTSDEGKGGEGQEEGSCDGGPCSSLVCGTGTCDPDKGNGRGIYVVEQGNYCIKPLQDREEIFCPEALVMKQGGGIFLSGYSETPNNPRWRREFSVKGRFNGVLPMDITDMDAKNSEFAVTYRTNFFNLEGTTTHVLKGEDLRKLKLEFVDHYNIERDCASRQLARKTASFSMSSASPRRLWACPAPRLPTARPPTARLRPHLSHLSFLASGSIRSMQGLPSTPWPPSSSPWPVTLAPSSPASSGATRPGRRLHLRYSPRPR